MQNNAILVQSCIKNFRLKHLKRQSLVKFKDTVIKMGDINELFELYINKNYT